MDVFVDDSLGLYQGPIHRHRHVYRTLFHTLDQVFRTLDKLYPSHIKEVLSLNKLNAGDCSWSSCKVILGWVVDTVNKTLCLPPHQASESKKNLPFPYTSGISALKNGISSLGSSGKWILPSMVLDAYSTTYSKPFSVLKAKVLRLNEGCITACQTPDDWHMTWRSDKPASMSLRLSPPLRMTTMMHPVICVEEF